MRIVRVRVCACLMVMLAAFGAVAAQEKSDRAIEERIVQYLREHVKPGERVIVSDLNNNVFKTPEERKVLERMFNTFFKIPLFVAQYKASTNEVPSLADIARQFSLPVPGEVAVLLTIMESDPRVPSFITRDPKSGEITAVDVEAVKKDRRFGQLLERTLAGRVGKDAPAFSMDLFTGKPVSSDQLKGKNYLLYFWFSGCPPCAKIAPHMTALQRRFGSRNFTVVAANADRLLELDTTDQQRAGYVKKEGWTFPAGHVSKQMMESFGAVNVYPTLFLVDSKGVIVKQYVNYQPLNVLADDVSSILK